MQCARAIPVTWLGSGSCQAGPSRLNTNEWRELCLKKYTFYFILMLYLNTRGCPLLRSSNFLLISHLLLYSRPALVGALSDSPNWRPVSTFVSSFSAIEYEDLGAICCIYLYRLVPRDFSVLFSSQSVYFLEREKSDFALIRNKRWIICKTAKLRLYCNMCIPVLRFIFKEFHIAYILYMPEQQYFNFLDLQTCGVQCSQTATIVCLILFLYKSMM